jgi:ribosomal protein S18 acetylase RimI-like enzyme
LQDRCYDDITSRKHYFTFVRSMNSFTNMHIAFAAIDDIVDIENLLNSAYRGEISKQGWTTEAFLIEGDTRTDENNLKQIMQLPGSIFLKYTNEMQQITGCVNLQQHEHKLYLGMFAVSPFLQGGGIGKQLLLASGEYAKQLQCKSIYMSVISSRTELINWYQRHGYSDTGERKFFEEDGLTGKHVQPLQFMILEKIIA